MDKQNVINQYDGVLFIHKKEWSLDTFYVMDEAQIYYARWNELVTRDYIMYNSVYIKVSTMG